MPKTNPIDKSIRAAAKPLPPEPLWDGPEEDSPNGGVTQSMIGKFLNCRERFRVRYMLGLQPPDSFNHRLGYGEMWHICEEALAAHRGSGGDSGASWVPPLAEHVKKLMAKYPLQREEIDHWCMVCLTQFPIYVDHWSKHKDVAERTSIFQEKEFNVPYQLSPGGRVVRLRGKWDAVDIISKGKNAGVYLQENKTKGDINPGQMRRQLSFDLQTMFYLTALNLDCGMKGVRGVIYNVVRRPLSGGVGTIRRGKSTKNKPEETKAEFYARLAGIMDGSAEESPGPDYFFMRWKVEITKHDVDQFCKTFLNPVLLQLCQWWDWIKTSAVAGAADGERYENNLGLHWRHPFGVYNSLDEGGATDLDEHLVSGSMTGLVRGKTVFPELNGG